MTPSISVIMSVLNGEQFLRESVESVLVQSFADFEFVIINDGSTDRSGMILDGYQKQDRRLQVHHQPNGGLVSSLNRGCALARSRYIARMDADDVAIRDRLSWQIEFMESHPEVAVLGGAVQFIDASGKSLKVARHPLRNRDLQHALLYNSVFWHPSVMIRRSAFDSVGGYRQIRDAEDYDLWLRLAEQFELANLQSVVLKYRVHRSQVTVRSCRQQALSFLAARESALSRRSGKPDPLESSASHITSALLSTLGVSEEAQEAEVGKRYLQCMAILYDAGESSVATARDLVRYSRRKAIPKWVAADLCLLAARIYWRERHFTRFIFGVASAIARKPKLVGRPFKRVLLDKLLRRTRVLDYTSHTSHARTSS